MANLARVTINWTGFIGAPGYTNLYWRNTTPGTITQNVVDEAVSKTDTWLTQMKTVIASTVTVGIDASVEEINDATGALVAFWTGAPAAASAGTSAGAYSAAAGACIAWSTNAVRNNRRIRGRTFIVPVGGASLAVDGTLDALELSTLRSASDALRASGADARLVIWGRPTTPGGTDGVSAEVIASNVQDKTAVLTSRRD
jgi:hypothetical protein